MGDWLAKKKPLPKFCKVDGQVLEEIEVHWNTSYDEQTGEDLTKYQKALSCRCGGSMTLIGGVYTKTKVTSG